MKLLGEGRRSLDPFILATLHLGLLSDVSIICEVDRFVILPSIRGGATVSAVVEEEREFRHRSLRRSSLTPGDT